MRDPIHHEWLAALTCGCVVRYAECGPTPGDVVCCATHGPTVVGKVERLRMAVIR